jgi:cytoskeletal protein RodZ
MSSVGELLQGARLEQKLDLPTVSARTKISVRYLTAIEADDRQTLPSGFFYKSFVDQYATFLGLDTQALGAEVDRLLSADAPLPLPGFESIVSRNVAPVKVKRRFSSSRVWAPLTALVAVVVGCSGIYVWWHQPKPAGSPSVAEKRVAVQPVAPVSVTSDASDEKPPAPTADTVLLDLMAREETWLSVVSEGKHLFSGILAANQTKTVEGKESATMKVGNAAGIEVRLNGKLLGPLGARGQVLVVVFRPDRFQIVPPAPKVGD